jgi:hypothetical protein
VVAALHAFLAVAESPNSEAAVQKLQLGQQHQ